MGNIIKCVGKYFIGSKITVSVKISGSVNSINVVNGDVQIGGSTMGNVSTVDGDISAGKINGFIRSINGDIGHFSPNRMPKVSVIKRSPDEMLNIIRINGTCILTINSCEYAVNSDIRMAGDIITIDNNLKLAVEDIDYVDIMIMGDCDQIRSGPINISVDGDVKSDIRCMNGNVTVSGSIYGNVTTTNGDIYTSSKKSSRSIESVNGDIYFQSLFSSD
jgi:DUF4097 and DUF4098 domain-containing protein YvlB